MTAVTPWTTFGSSQRSLSANTNNSNVHYVFACGSNTVEEAGLGNSRTEIPRPLRLNVSYCNDSIAAPCSLGEATLLFHIRNVIKNDTGIHNYFLPILFFFS
jgi:hypothetical protein